MILKSFTVNNYRSIAKAYKLPLTDYSVIVGPNNEGKSNILKGLALSLAILSDKRSYKYKRPFPSRISTYKGIDRLDYEWLRDYPISLQACEPDGRSEFTLEFILSDIEYDEFYESVKVKLTTNLKVKISFGSEDTFKTEVLMKGKGKVSLNNKHFEISNFVSHKLLVQYIPAVRTSELAINIVENLLERELSYLTENPEFKTLLTQISKLQQPILRKIGKSLTETVSGFIPDVKSITVENKENVARILSASCNVLIDDGTKTDVRLKGDGVISLTAISLLRHISQDPTKSRALILLIEEPESHLHPKAIHRLKTVLSDISTKNQVIVTTHSPILVEKASINHNIIVQRTKAIPAKNLSEIRECLGIHMSDNLTSAFLVLLVEGLEDKLVLNKWLGLKSKLIKDALDKGTLIIDHLGGASNISYKSSLYKANLCNIFGFLDNDNSGRKSIQDALDKGTLKFNEYSLCNCRGMKNSELEDLFILEKYRQQVIDVFGVDLQHKDFKNNKEAWSERVKAVFKSSGKLWNDLIEKKLKNMVSELISSKGLETINKHKESPIVALIDNIEKILIKK